MVLWRQIFKSGSLDLNTGTSADGRYIWLLTEEVWEPLWPVCGWKLSAGRDQVSNGLIWWFEPVLHFYCPTFSSCAHFRKTCKCYISPCCHPNFLHSYFFAVLHISVFFLVCTPVPIRRGRTQEQPVWARLIICAREHGRLLVSRSASRFAEGPAKDAQSLHLQQRMDEEVSYKLMLASINS